MTQIIFQSKTDYFLIKDCWFVIYPSHPPPSPPSLSFTLCHTCYSTMDACAVLCPAPCCPQHLSVGAGVDLLSLPPCVHEVDNLRTPLRCLPVVQREVDKATYIDNSPIPSYRQAAHRSLRRLLDGAQWPAQPWWGSPTALPAVWPGGGLPAEPPGGGSVR